MFFMVYTLRAQIALVLLSECPLGLIIGSINVAFQTVKLNTFDSRSLEKTAIILNGEIVPCLLTHAEKLWFRL